MNEKQHADRTCAWPSAVLWDLSRTWRGRIKVVDAVNEVWEALEPRDTTEAVYDLLPLAVWAMSNGAPEELVGRSKRDYAPPTLEEVRQACLELEAMGLIERAVRSDGEIEWLPTARGARAFDDE